MWKVRIIYLRELQNWIRTDLVARTRFNKLSQMFVTCKTSANTSTWYQYSKFASYLGSNTMSKRGKMSRTWISIRVSMVVFEVIRTRLGFGIRVNTNLVYQYRTSLRLREQSFEIHFGFELRIGTPLCRNLSPVDWCFKLGSGFGAPRGKVL